MHGSAGLHSALAIKRQRRHREQAKKRAAERRLSNRTNSTDSIEHPPRRGSFHPPNDTTFATSIGMLHLGVCFMVLGLFLIGSGLLPDDIVTWSSGGWWNELVLTGIFVLAIGLFFIILNRIMSTREEEELEDYVSRQLTRSRSGHRLERDVETGCLTTKNHRRLLEKQREDKNRGLTDIAPTHHHKVPPADGEIYLEKILEEEINEKEMDSNRHFEYKETISNTTTASLSPGTPSEVRELLANGRQYSFNSRQY
ncbi:uncharacterized protein LOC114332290 [Diabrotica virgifera virgifera]|uniref:Uncharacterized protein n=1 Tax=Diabrotica virgifera virgifera TaxID=50390 RepID=A0ABM5IP71_DIAVI|nr:uncharacterized protein LOC114332290 [Diabrotica virgifera virgifera]